MNHSRRERQPLGLCLRRRPFIDLLQGIAHECSPVGLGQAVRDAERLDTLFVGQQRGRSGPIRAAHTAIDDPNNRIPGCRCPGKAGVKRTGPADFYPDVVVGREGQRLRQISPRLRRRRSAGMAAASRGGQWQAGYRGSPLLSRRLNQGAPRPSRIHWQRLCGSCGESLVDTRVGRICPRVSRCRHDANADRAFRSLTRSASLRCRSGRLGGTATRIVSCWTIFWVTLPVWRTRCQPPILSAGPNHLSASHWRVLPRPCCDCSCIHNASCAPEL